MNTTNNNKFGLWQQPVQVMPNNFIHKGLSDFAVNIAVGCGHGCIVCSVPSTSAVKQKWNLEPYGVKDPDAEWGEYALLRKWDEKLYLNSLIDAQMTPTNKLSRDGHRAVIFCSTTDAYQVFSGHPDWKKLNQHEEMIRRRSLTLILECSDLNVRILTRNPSAKNDFDIFKSFGNRLMFGMSIPTSDAKLAKKYEPDSPSVDRRFDALRHAKAEGIPIFVAIAPSYPECDAANLDATLREIANLDPVCVYHEPVNIRAKNVPRIEEHAKELGIVLDTKVFSTPEAWRRYAMGHLFTVQRLAEKYGVIDRLKLWPDADLKTKSHFLSVLNEDGELDAAAKEAAYQHHVEWLESWWSKLPAWPGVAPQSNWTVPAIPSDSPFVDTLLEVVK